MDSKQASRRQPLGETELRASQQKQVGQLALRREQVQTLMNDDDDDVVVVDDDDDDDDATPLEVATVNGRWPEPYVPHQ